MADGLRCLDGVADVEVDLQRNLCVVTPDPSRLLALDAVPEAVRRTGFRAGRIWVAVTGNVTAARPGPGLLFHIDGDPVERWWEIPGRTPGAVQVTARIDGDPPRLVPESPP